MSYAESAETPGPPWCWIDLERGSTYNLWMSATYDGDVVAWANEQAALLRAGKFDRLDIEHIADEVEDVGKSEERELATRMALLMAHLLKWAFQPERRTRSWELTIAVQRKAIDKRIAQMPSLKTDLADPEWHEIVWGDAVRQAATETGLDVFPLECPWTQAQVRDSNFMPDANSPTRE